jgi:hypothetical protein
MPDGLRDIALVARVRFGRVSADRRSREASAQLAAKRLSISEAFLDFPGG